MADFLPFIRRWFDETFAEATRPQREGWEAIASGRDALIVAPTGSGKTLAAFLWALDHLHRLALDRQLEDRVYVVYVSPLRARCREPAPADRLLGDGEPDRVRPGLPDGRHRRRRGDRRRRLYARPRSSGDRTGGRLPDGVERHHLGSGAPADRRAGAGPPDHARVRAEPTGGRAARARPERPDRRRARRSAPRLTLPPRAARGRASLDAGRAARGRRHLLARAGDRRRRDRPGRPAPVAAQHRRRAPARPPRPAPAEPHLA